MLPVHMKALQSAIDRVFSTHFDSLRPVDAIDRIVREGLLDDFINRVRCDTRSLQTIARRSYLHPNGFDKIVLIDSQRPAYKLRLHVWLPSEEQKAIAPEDVHNHRWDFCSHVLMGSLDWEEYVLTDSGEPRYQYHYRSPGNSDAFSLESVGTVRTQRVFETTLPAGLSYRLQHGVLHRVTGCATGPSITAFLQGPAVTGFTTVLKTTPYSPDPVNLVGLRRLTVPDLTTRLDLVRTVLHAPAAGAATAGR